MKISHGTRIESIEESNGYGYATANMIESLTRLGYEVNQNDSTADVEIWFDQPHHWKFTPGTYKIGYHPWESTLLLDGWSDIMNECDEIWTPSPLIAEWYRTTAGVTVPVYVYEHGVSPDWKPVDRKVKEKFSFLHCGAEASRKGGIDAMKAFRKAFPNQDDVELRLKIISQGWNINRLNRIEVLNKRLSFPELLDLFATSHAYVYPSWGEGFGLTPLQAMATGMPTITLPAWAPYSQFLDSNLNVSSKLYKSQWPRIHPGAMFKPDMDDLVDSMRYVYDNYDKCVDFAHSQIDALVAYYDWDRITKQVFNDLENRLENR